MKSLIILVSSVMLFPSLAYGEVIYNFMNYPNDQGGHTLSGSLTTVGTAADDGLLAVNEIVSWQVEIDGADGFSHSSDEGGVVWIDGTVKITPTEITLDHVENEIHTFELLTDSHQEVLRYLRISDIFGAGVFDHYSANPAWENNDPTISGASDSWVLASADPLMDANLASWATQEPGVLSIFSFRKASASLQAVPEPSSFLPFVIGLFAAGRLRASRK